MTQEQREQRPEQRPGLSPGKVVAIVFVAILLTVGGVLLCLKMWLFSGPFTPVVLSPQERQQVERKLDWLEHAGGSGRQGSAQPQREQPTREDLTPEPYSEAGANREIRLSEREINGMIAQNTDLATRLVVDFADDLVSVKLLIPVDPDFPVMGGKILKVRAGAELAFRNGRPVVILRGVSVMGVPLPNAWLGGLKNIDLVQVFGTDPGFWQSFAEGVAAIEVREGQLRIVLKE